MNDTQVTIRTDTKTKEAIAAFAKSLGLSTGAFMLAAARESMYKERVTLTPLYNPRFVAQIREAETEIEQGDYITVKPGEDLKEALSHAFADE